MPRKKLTDETHWRGDVAAQRQELMDEEEKAATNQALDAATHDMSASHWHVTAEKRTIKMAGGMIDPTEWNLGNIPEPEVLDDGEEVRVTISSVTDAETKSGSIPYWRIMLEVQDRPLVNEFSYNLYKPHEGQSQKQEFKTKYAIQNFMKAFNLDMSRPFDPEMDWLGETAGCLVNMKEDREYGKQNSVRKWILPR